MFGSCFRTLAVIIASVFVLLFCYLVSAEGSYSKDCGGGDVNVCVSVCVCVCVCDASVFCMLNMYVRVYVCGKSQGRREGETV